VEKTMTEPEENRRLPFNLARRRTVDDFEWGWHARAYLKHCFKGYTGTVHELAALCGYKNISKFQRRRAAWVDGEWEIPRVFLNTIGVQLDVLEQAVALDRKGYEEALEHLPIPTSFFVKALPGIYLRETIPPVANMAEAYEYVQRNVEAQGCEAMTGHLYWPMLKAVTFRAGREPVTFTFAPKLTLKGESVSLRPPPGTLFCTTV